MAASVSDLDNFKLSAEFLGDDVVVHDKVIIWKQVKIIGQGAYGSVFLQKRTWPLGRPQEDNTRAVKRVSLSSLPEKGPSQELLALLKLTNDNTHFVKFLGWYDNPEYIFYAMEYIKDGDLHSYMTQDREGAHRDAKEITRQILEGLVVLQKEGICHRDLKPQNILIASREPIWVKITDFGVAKQLDGTIPRSSQGTEGYRSPELLGILPKDQQRQQQIGYALDIWSLGAMLHELLTSFIPFFDSEAFGDGSGGSSSVIIIGGSASTVRRNFNFDFDAFYQFCRGNSEFPIERLRKACVSPAGIAFVQSLLVSNPQSRPEPFSALHGPLLCDWIGGVIGEFLRMGVDLDLRYVREHELLGEKGSDYFLQCLPISERERIGALLAKAVSMGYLSATSILLGIPSGELTNPLTSVNYSEAFLQAIELQNTDLIELFLKISTFDADIEGTFESRKFLKAVALQEEKMELNYGKILRFAAGSDHISTVRILLKINSNIGEPFLFENLKGLLLATKNGHTAIVNLFREAGVDINIAKSEYGHRLQTTLQMVMEAQHLLGLMQNQLAVIEGLVREVFGDREAGAKINAKSELQKVMETQLVLEGTQHQLVTGGLAKEVFKDVVTEDQHMLECMQHQLHVTMTEVLASEAGFDINHPWNGHRLQKALQAVMGVRHVLEHMQQLIAVAEGSIREYFRAVGVELVKSRSLNYRQKLRSVASQPPAAL